MEPEQIEPEHSEPEQIPLRARFFAMCKEHLAARPGGGCITSEASRLLLKYVKQYMAKLPLPNRNMESITIRALNRFPNRRIDRDQLEKSDLIPRSVAYAESATGDEFKYRALLGEAFIDGEAKVLIDWVPTWEPVANVPKSALKEFRDNKRKKRRDKRRAKTFLAKSRPKK